MTATNLLQMLEFAERRTLAHRHVKEGRRILERQRQIIAQKKAADLDTGSSEQLLAQFEISQKLFEEDLASLLREATRHR